jgi:hypothetical protein
MNRFFAVVAVMGVCTTSQAAQEQGAAASRDVGQQMTRGLTNQKPDGTPGINYQGGIAGYAGPTRDGNSIGTDVTSLEQLRANAEAEIARQKAAIERQRAELIEKQNQQRAIQQDEAAKREAARAQAQQARKAERNQHSFKFDVPAQVSRGGSPAAAGSGGTQQNTGDLIMACGAKGFTADFASGNCVSPQGRQTNPHNLYPPFAAPLPTPQPGDLIMRCGAIGRGVDFVTGRCM